MDDPSGIFPTSHKDKVQSSIFGASLPNSHTLNFVGWLLTWGIFTECYAEEPELFTKSWSSFTKVQLLAHSFQRKVCTFFLLFLAKTMWFISSLGYKRKIFELAAQATRPYCWNKGQKEHKKAIQNSHSLIHVWETRTKMLWSKEHIFTKIIQKPNLFSIS